jgi:uncharacterized protein (DUF1778 family)
MTARWSFRVEPAIDRLVREAAAASGQTLTEFVLGAAGLAADRVLARRTPFVLERGRWERFVELLDRPPRDNPGLERLFSQPSVFDGE